MAAQSMHAIMGFLGSRLRTHREKSDVALNKLRVVEAQTNPDPEEVRGLREHYLALRTRAEELQEIFELLKSRTQVHKEEQRKLRERTKKVERSREVKRLAAERKLKGNGAQSA